MLNIHAARVRAALEGDRAFCLSLRFLSGRVHLQIDDRHYLLEIADGALRDFSEVQGRPDADVRFVGTSESWNKIWQENPPPGCQSPFYNDGRCGVSYEGDTVSAVGPMAKAISEFFRVLKADLVPSPVALLPEVDRDFDSIVGRYLYVHVQGVQYRIYFEEAGNGPIPFLMQHTAGADSRQSRYILEDPDFQKHFRMIAYDLPFHGRSLPPSSHKWWDEPFVLTRAFLLELLDGISRKLGLDRPVFMGSAMSGLLGLDLAYFRPDDYRAILALNVGPPPQADQKIMDQTASFSDPHVSGQWLSTMFAANTASTSPEVFRRELGFIYDQAARGIPEGALNYFWNEYDLTPEQAATIDTDKVAVYLFTGEDDYTGTPYGTDLLAEKFRTASYKRLRSLGHFGAAENPQALKEDIWPAIEEIVARSAT